MKVGIPIEIKDYAISGNAGTKQSLLNCERGEFYESQEMNRNDNPNQNQIQIQANSIVQDAKKQEILDTLQSNLNTIMSQKNLQQQQQLKPQNMVNSEEQSEFNYKTTEADNDEPNQPQFEKLFQQNIQKQLQYIKQIKTSEDNSNQKQILNPQAQMNIQQKNTQITNSGINGNPPSSKSTVLQYQQYLQTVKFQSPSPSQNQKNLDKQSTIQNKQTTPGSNHSYNTQLNNYMVKPTDFQEAYQYNQQAQQNIQSKKSTNTTPSSENKKLNPNVQQNLQQNQYIPLSQQIQNQINNNRISEDAKQQQATKEQNGQIIQQQQLIEQQKQKILKNYQETFQKQQSKQIVLNQQEKKNYQHIISQNAIKQKQQSMIQQPQQLVVQTSPGRRKTTDETNSNTNPKHVFLKLKSEQNEQQKQEDINQILSTKQTQNMSNQIFSQNNLTSKRLETDGSVKQSENNETQNQYSIKENNLNQQSLPPKDYNNSKSATNGNYELLYNQQTSNNVNQNLNQDNIHKQMQTNKGSAYQNQSSLQLIKKMMEQKDYKELEIPKYFDNSNKGQGQHPFYESQGEQQSPEIKQKKQYNNIENGNSIQDPDKQEQSFGREQSFENQRQSEFISNFGVGNSFQEDKKTEISIQSLSKSQVNAMNLSNISKSGKMRNSQESLMKSLEERKKHTIAANNQKCIIFTKDQNKQQNSSFTNQNSQKKTQSNQKMQTIIGTTTYPNQEDLYYVNGSMESLQKQSSYPHPQNTSGKQLQNYYNQPHYEEQIRQSQMLQQEDEEALQHQQYLREQDMLLQQQISQSGDIHSPHIYECTSQGYIKSNVVQDLNVKQPIETILQNLETSNGEQIQGSDQNVIQSAQIQNSNHMTFGPNQKNNLKQQMQELQNNMILQKSNQMNVVNVNQMLKQQNQVNGQINMDSYQMSKIQSPDNNRYQNQGISVYSSIDNVSSQQYLQQNSRGRIGSNMSNCMKLNSSTDTVNNISRISGINQQYYNGNLANVYHQTGAGHSSDINLSTNMNYQNQQNQSYVSSLSNNREKSLKKNERDEHSQTSVQQINKKELNWLNYSSFERNNIWMRLKQQNRQNLKQELNEREQQECTFKPSLIASRKPGLMKQYTQACISQPKLPTTYSNNKKIIRDYSDNSRVQGMGNSGYFNNGNPTTTNDNNSMSQNNSTYQLANGIKNQNNNQTTISAMKQSNVQNNVQTAQNNTDNTYQFLSLAQSPTSLHQEMKKAVSYAQINQLKKNTSSTPNLLHNIPKTAPNSTQNKGYAQGSYKKQTPYQHFKPNVIY